MRPVEVFGVRVDVQGNQPIVLLYDEASDKYLPIWIGAVEATAIAFVQEGVEPQRPLTHDLLKDVVSALGHRLTAVNITDLRDGIFFAELVFEDGTVVSARPSDAIALALRTSTPVFASEEVLAEAAVELPADEDANEAPADDEVEAFREFLDNVSPEDFEGGQTSD